MTPMHLWAAGLVVAMLGICSLLVPWHPMAGAFLTFVGVAVMWRANA